MEKQREKAIQKEKERQKERERQREKERQKEKERKERKDKEREKDKRSKDSGRFSRTVVSLVHVTTKLFCSCIMNIRLRFVIGSDGASKLETSPPAGPDPVRIKVRKQFKDALAARYVFKFFSFLVFSPQEDKNSELNMSNAK